MGAKRTVRWLVAVAAVLLAVPAEAGEPKRAGGKATVEVLDASAGPDFAKLVQAIKDAGFEVGHEGKAEVPRTVSEVYFAPGFEADAKKIAAALGAPEQAVQRLSWKSPWNIVVAAASGRSVDSPRFKQHPAREACSGPPAPADFDSNPDAKRFATRIRDGVKAGPNFAGCFAVVEWGCGSGCQSLVIVDTRSGRVHSVDFSTSEGSWFRADSALFVANPIDAKLWKGRLPPPGYLTTRFLVWEGSGFRELGKSRAAADRDALEK